MRGGGTKFHLLLTGEGCKGVAVPPATDSHYALGVQHFIYLFLPGIYTNNVS